MDNHDMPQDGFSRRKFLGTTIASSAALMTGGVAALFEASSSTAEALTSDAPWIEATIPQLQALISSGALTSRKLTANYLNRIANLNPLLGAVIEVNPNALIIAQRRDEERLSGHSRGPLHGIPVLVKDNIATHDAMQTTAGSLALVGSRVPADAVIVQRLRAAGAVILGKANLSEWANFRGFAPFNGWSARGGFTRDPYKLSFDPCGSSSGSAVAAAASLCSTAVGTETDGSIVCPAGNNLIVGLKPTVGLVSQQGIIPISHTQDTAGPMCRTVTDTAIMLNALKSPFGRVLGHTLPTDYTTFLHRLAFDGARIGVDRRYFTADYGAEPDLVAIAQKGLDAMESLGATLVDTDSGDSNAYFDDEVTVLLFEFKVQIAQYLAGLTNTNKRTLQDLIAFDIVNCPAEMKYFGQEVFELAQATSGNLSDPVYLAAKARARRLAGRDGIDAALQRDNLDAIVAPTYSFASTPAAVAGYPDISIPVGISSRGRPAGLWMYSGFLREPKLLGFAYALMLEIRPRRQPQFLGTVPPEPPDAGICGSARPQILQPSVIDRSVHLPYHLGTGKALKN